MPPPSGTAPSTRSTSFPSTPSSFLPRIAPAPSRRRGSAAEPCRTGSGTSWPETSPLPQEPSRRSSTSAEKPLCGAPPAFALSTQRSTISTSRARAGETHSRNLGCVGKSSAGRRDLSMDMNKMLQQVQQLQAQMAQAQEELKNETVEASAGGGMVTVKATGDLQITEINIAPEAIDPDDPEMLSDMVLAAVNEALRSAQALAQSKLGGMAGLGDLGGMGLPGL